MNFRTPNGIWKAFRHDPYGGVGDRGQARRCGTRRRADRLGGRRVHPRRGGRRTDVGAGDGDRAARYDPPRTGPVDRRDDRLRSADGLHGPAPADRRQTFDGRSRRQDHPAAGAAGGRLRGGGAPVVGARTGAHRRDSGQIGIDSGLAGRSGPRTDARDPHRSEDRRGDLRGRGWIWRRPTSACTRCAT